MEIGKNIYELRKKEGLSQLQLAEKINVSRQTISNWELNQTTPDIVQSKQLANFFNVSLDELIGNDIKEVLMKKVINTEKMTNKIMDILKCLIFLIVGWTIIMIITISICKINFEEIKRNNEKEEKEFSNYISSLRSKYYLGSFNGSEFRLQFEYCSDNNLICGVALNSLVLNEDKEIQHKNLEELVNYINKYNVGYENYKEKNNDLDNCIYDVKEFFENKGGKLEYLSNPYSIVK